MSWKQVPVEQKQGCLFLPVVAISLRRNVHVPSKFSLSVNCQQTRFSLKTGLPQTISSLPQHKIFSTFLMCSLFVVCCAKPEVMQISIWKSPNRLINVSQFEGSVNCTFFCRFHSVMVTHQTLFSKHSPLSTRVRWVFLTTRFAWEDKTAVSGSMSVGLGGAKTIITVGWRHSSLQTTPLATIDLDLKENNKHLTNMITN